MTFIRDLLFVIVLIGLDQYTKYLTVSNIRLYERIEIIPGFFDLTYYQNRGAGFSILQGQMTFFFIVTAVAVCFLIYLYLNRKKDAILENITILLMMGGTIGNFIDRFMNGYVVDFLSFNIFGYPFPVFNVADICLTIGVFLYLGIYLWEIKDGKL